MKTFDWFEKIMILVVIIITIGFSYSYSHEGYGWFHMKESSGPCIGTERCGFDTVWMIDYNDDGKIDRCIANRLIHDKWHIKDYKVDEKNNKCTCEEL